MSLLSAYEGEQARRQAQEGARQAFLGGIQDPVTREIAGHLHGPEPRQNELQALQRLAREHADSSADLSDAARVAHARALRQGNFSALDGLDRELSKQLDEEQHAMLLLLMHEE